MLYSTFYNGLLDHKYVSLGIQYYLLARVGSHFIFNPTSGSLYHLSFELLFKSYLKNKYSAHDLQNIFGHNLVKLWNELKTNVLTNDFKKIDLIVKNLDTWEKVRYLELRGGKDAHSIELVKGSAPKDYLQKIDTFNFASLDCFRLYVDDMDELFMTFFSILKIPSEELLKNPDFNHGKELYEQDNKYNLFSR
jgi:hypothetical protein